MLIADSARIRVVTARIPELLRPHGSPLVRLQRLALARHFDWLSWLPRNAALTASAYALSSVLLTLTGDLARIHMRTPSDELNAVDRLIHEPLRLAILTALSACENAEYLYLQRLTGTTGGNLASHVRRLAGVGLVEIHKGYAGNMPETRASITPKGREAIEAYWKQIEVVRVTFSDREFIERWRERPA